MVMAKFIFGLSGKFINREEPPLLETNEFMIYLHNEIAGKVPYCPNLCRTCRYVFHRFSEDGICGNLP